MARAQARALRPSSLIPATVLALLPQAALFFLLATDHGWLPTVPGWTARPIELWLAPPALLQPPAPDRRIATPTAPARFSVPTAPPSARQAAPPAALIARAPGADERPGAGPALAAVLRQSAGCGQLDALMSDADRAACRDRLAAGAASAAHLEGMAPAKHAYYAAEAKAQQDWLSGRNPGHLPFPYCGLSWGPGEPHKPPPHALVFGPCFIDPPRGSLDPDVDVPPIGEARDPADAPPPHWQPWPNHNRLYGGRRPAAHEDD